MAETATPLTFEQRTRAYDRAAVESALRPTPEQAKALAYVQRSDYWQGGSNWVGSELPLGDTNAAGALGAPPQDFVAEPVLEECAERHVAGVVGREPSFSFVLSRELAEGEEPTPEEATDLSEANSLLGAWFDQKQVLALVHAWVMTLISAGRAPARLFVPRDFLRVGADGTRFDVGLAGTAADGAPPKLERALAAIHAQLPDLSSAGVTVDEDAMRPVALARGVRREWILRNGQLERREAPWIELCWADEAGSTHLVVREFDDRGSARPEEEIAFGGGGALLIFEARRKALLTPAVCGLQNTVNMLASMLPRNAKYAGHRSRDFFNVKKTTERARNPATGQIEEVEVEPALGAGIVNFWASEDIQDAEGNVRALPATVVFGEPVDSSPLRGDIDHFKDAILSACKQLHSKISGDAVASAVSRVQARAEFADSLLLTKPHVEALLRWMLKTVALLACHLCEDKARAKRWQALRVRVDVKPYAGPLLPEDVRVVLEMFKSGLLSRETAQVMLGIEDVDAENALLKAEEENRLRLTKQRAELLQTLTSAGATVGAAARVAGFGEAEAKMLEHDAAPAGGAST